MTDPQPPITETDATDATPRPRLSLKLDGGISAGLALLVVFLICPMLNHYGLTYDEGWYVGTAERARLWVGTVLRYPGRGLSREGVLDGWAASIEVAEGSFITEMQPGAPKLVNGIAGRGLGKLFGAVPPERAGTALFMAACVAALYLLLASVWGRSVGLFAVLALLTMPRVFAHTHLSALDIPVMAASFVSVALMFAAVVRSSTKLAILSGLAWGVAMGCKINAVFVPMILAAWILWLHRPFALRAALALVAGGAIAFFLSWPWLWYDTFAHLSEYFAFHLKHYPVGVSYFGTISGHQPWHYPSVMAAIATPPATLLLAIGGAVICALCLRKPPDEAPSIRTWQRSLAVLLLIGALFSIGVNSLPSAPKYNGVRLFMPFFAYAAAFAGIGFDRLSRWAASRLPDLGGSLLTPTRVRVGAALLLLLPAVRATVASHPYQMSYYNALIGGLPGAVERGMEATYWGDVYTAAMSQFAFSLGPDDLVWIDLPGCEWIARINLPLDKRDHGLTSGGKPPLDATWAVVQNKITELRPETKALIAAGPPVGMVALDGVPLAYIFDNAGVRRGLALLEQSEAAGGTDE